MLKVVVQGAMLIGALFGIGWSVLYGPHYVEYLYMQDVVKTGALTWVAFDQNRAKLDMQHELEQQGIEDVVVEDCLFNEYPNEKEVSCQWKVDIFIPVVGQTRRIKFFLSEAATPDGRLAD